MIQIQHTQRDQKFDLCTDQWTEREQGVLANTGSLLYLLLGPLCLSHLKAESLNLLCLTLYFLLLVTQLASKALLCRPVCEVS